MTVWEPELIVLSSYKRSVYFKKWKLLKEIIIFFLDFIYNLIYYGANKT